MPNQHKTKHKKNHLSQKVKDIWVYSIGSLVILAGVILSYIGIYLPPPGEIHSTVLVALGQLCLFGAAIFGIPYYVKNEVGEFKTAMYKYINKKAENITSDEPEEVEEE